MEWLNYFSFEYISNSTTGFALDRCILMDDYSILDYSSYENQYWGITNTYSFSREFYYKIDEYLEVYYPETEKEDITELSIGNNVIIKDYSGLLALTNLNSLDFYNMDLTGIDFEVAPKLENIYVYNCTLNGKLDFTRNTNLKYIDINVSGDLTNAIVDIRGLTNLEYFNYEYYTDRASDFDLITCILRYCTFELTHNSDTESMYENYYYNNYSEDPDEPIYPENPDEPIEPDYPEYIISNLNTYEIEDGTSIIYGFVLNEEKTLTLGDIQTRNYFAEGVTAKVFDESGTEITDTTSIIGTGKVIKLYKDEELVEEHTVVIYGDATGDGKINSVDALAIIKNKNQNLLLGNKILEEAGRVTEKSYSESRTPSAVDALAVIKYANGKYDIDQRYYYYDDGYYG